MKDSPKYNLNKKDLIDIAVMAGFSGLAAIAMFLVEQVLPNMDFGKYAPYITPLIPVITYTIKKWAQGK
jgi:hypothetical protein